MIDALARESRQRRTPAGRPPGGEFHPLTLDDLAAYIAACTAVSRKTTPEKSLESIPGKSSTGSGRLTRAKRSTKVQRLSDRSD